jgi:hypothetical protein
MVDPQLKPRRIDAVFQQPLLHGRGISAALKIFSYPQAGPADYPIY